MNFHVDIFVLKDWRNKQISDSLHPLQTNIPFSISKNSVREANLETWVFRKTPFNRFQLQQPFPEKKKKHLSPQNTFIGSFFFSTPPKKNLCKHIIYIYN